MTTVTFGLTLVYATCIAIWHWRRRTFGINDRDEVMRDIRRRSIAFLVSKEFEEKSTKKLDLFLVIEDWSINRKSLLFAYPNRNVGLVILSFFVFTLQILIIIYSYLPTVFEIIPSYLIIDILWLFSLFFITLIFSGIWLYFDYEYWVDMGRYRDHFSNDAVNSQFVIIEDDGDSGKA